MLLNKTTKPRGLAVLLYYPNKQYLEEITLLASNLEGCPIFLLSSLTEKSYKIH